MRLLAKNWEILAESRPIDSAESNLVHPLICYTRRQAPPYSQRATKS